MAEEIPQVDIEMKENGYKFICLESDDEKVYIFGNSRAEYHRDLLREWWEKYIHAVPGHMAVKVRGGVFIDLSFKLQRVSVSGVSLDYGEFNIEKVRTVLEDYIDENLKGFNLIIF